MDRNHPHVVLIVEDDQLLQLLTTDILEDAGFTVIHAENADQAVAILEVRFDIGILLTDINMPGSMDGLKLAHAVRDRWPPIKIIIVSSRAPESGLPAESRFLSKPYQSAVLISEIWALVDS